MSLIFSLLLLLGLSVHACDVRAIGAIVHPSITKEGDEKLNQSARVSIASRPNVEQDDDDQTAMNGSSDEAKRSGAAQSEPEASVRWPVPHRKKEPGFNLDYLPPKTHPPVHN